MSFSTAADADFVPPSSTLAFSASASANALRLSPVAPALLRTVKVSPVAGAPLTCDAPAVDVDVAEPAVYVKLPRAVHRVGSRGSELDVDRGQQRGVGRVEHFARRDRAGAGVGRWRPRCGSAPPRRSCDGSVMATLMPASASRVGRIVNWSPVAMPAPTTMDRPSAMIGSADRARAGEADGRARILAAQRVARGRARRARSRWP